ncbi:uncharacterized protein [Apostichopus japonicus]|uniref:uncharacterized protein isoform X2 n=1 Tax=Stichopus japonicus TaxID=307972 RepID=UPI003AB327A4
MYMMLYLYFFLMFGCLQRMTQVIATQDDCPLSDVPVCGPTGICTCSYGGAKVDCENQNLLALPRNMPSNVTAMVLSDNKINCVPTKYFEQFTKLKFLVFGANNLQKSFLLPPSLEKLDVKNNQLEDLDNFFIHCDNLQVASLSINEIFDIPEYIFQICSRLEKLGLATNNVHRIWKHSFAGLSSLRELRLQNNYLMYLSEDSLSGACNNLRNLKLGSNNILALPPTLLRNCTKLERLDISWNGLTEIPEMFFGNQRMFRMLFMSFIKMKTIPEGLFENTSINSFLDLGNNDLEEIPKGLFSTNPNGHLMTSLLLCGNKLNTLPKGLFDNLHYLQNLYLNGNNLKTLPGSLLAGTTLIRLYLFQNKVERLTEPLFGNTQENLTLKEVLLQDNPIRQLSSAVLDEIVDEGVISLSCETLTLPTIKKNLKATCQPPSTPMVLNVRSEASLWFANRGFECSDTQIERFLTCTSCPTGTYGKLLGWESRCHACPKGGFYQDQVGQFSPNSTSIKCKICNPGTFVKEGAGQSPLSCLVCPTGTNKDASAGFRACFCLENYFRRDRFDKCEFCSQEGVQCKDDYMTIRKDYYWNWSYADIEGYKRFVENLLTFNESYEETATRVNGSLPKAHKCLKTGRCDNDVDQIAGNCAQGYTGWMCTTCDKNFFPIFGYCRHCPKLRSFMLELSIITIALVLFLFFLFKYYREQSEQARSVFDSMLALGKIVLGFYQVMGEFWETIDVIFWPQIFRNITAWLDLLQFNISSIIIKPKCFWPTFELTPYTAFTLGSVFPYFVMLCAILLIAAVNLHARVSEKRKPANVDDINSRLQRYQSNILTLLVLILFVTYTSTCNVTFALYGPTCDTYSLDEFDVHEISLLRSDYSISCNTTIHHRFQIASYCSSVYVVALPAVLCFLLWKYSRQDVRELEESVEDNSPKCLRFLNENYHPKFWYWEIIELIRKVSQTFVIVLFGWNSYFSITITLTLAVVFLSLHISFKPMKDRMEYYLQLAALWTIFFNMLVAAVPAPESFSGDIQADILVTFLVILNTSVIFIALVATFIKLGRFLCCKDCLKRGRNAFRNISREEELTQEEIRPLIT